MCGYTSSLEVKTTEKDLGVRMGASHLRFTYHNQRVHFLAWVTQEHCSLPYPLTPTAFSKIICMYACARTSVSFSSVEMNFLETSLNHRSHLTAY